MAERVKTYYLETRANPHFQWLLTKSKAAPEAALMDLEALRYFLGDPNATADTITARKLPYVHRLLYSDTTMCRLLMQNLDQVERFIANSQDLRHEAWSTRNSMYGRQAASGGPTVTTPDVDVEMGPAASVVGATNPVGDTDNTFDDSVRGFDQAWAILVPDSSVWQ